MLCPDIPKGDGLMLQGTPASMITKNFSFSVKKCKNRKTCKPEHEINKWIEDVQVDSWVVQQNMDFEEYDGDPIFYNMKYIRSWLLFSGQT